MSKKNIISNSLSNKCPRCQEGDLFVQPFELKKPVAMPKECPICGQLYEPEPGFYYGAMFISYILSAFTFLGIIGFCIMVLKFSLNVSMLIVLLFAILSYIPLMRFSRALWINFMINFDANAKVKKDTKSFG